VTRSIGSATDEATHAIINELGFPKCTRFARFV
jgi:hypothetical protein